MAVTPALTNDARLDQVIDELAKSLASGYGSRKDDYYALAYFEKILQLPRDIALQHVAFGNHDYGMDGFYFDQDKQQFRIFQFKNSKSISLFGESIKTLKDIGFRALFEDRGEVPPHQPIVDEARKCLSDNKDLITTVTLDFVFRGDNSEAEESRSLANQVGALEEDTAWMIQKYFNSDEVALDVRFITFSGIARDTPKVDQFSLRFIDATEHFGPDGLKMFMGFVPLVDFYPIATSLDRTFLERNIRFPLSPDGRVNRALKKTFDDCLVSGKRDPSLFAFHHNGITLSAARLEQHGENAILYRPRLLNGAQTISTFVHFWERNQKPLKQTAASERVDKLVIPCRFIVSASSDVINEITMSNNRQNPVLAWQLHANDQIQYEFEDWFRRHKIRYQRQLNALKSISAQEQEDSSFTDARFVEFTRLAKVYLAAEGELGKLSRFNDVFDNVKDYEGIFNTSRMNYDLRKLMLCYKSQWHKSQLATTIRDSAAKFSYAGRVKDFIWSLTCQAILNDKKVDDYAEEFGTDLRRPPKYYEWLRHMARSRVRFMLDAVVQDDEYSDKVENDNYTFTRTPQAFRKAMMFAARKWEGWGQRQLSSKKE